MPLIPQNVYLLHIAIPRSVTMWFMPFLKRPSPGVFALNSGENPSNRLFSFHAQFSAVLMGLFSAFSSDENCF